MYPVPLCDMVPGDHLYKIYRVLTPFSLWYVVRRMVQMALLQYGLQHSCGDIIAQETAHGQTFVNLCHLQPPQPHPHPC